MEVSDLQRSQDMRCDLNIAPPLPGTPFHSSVFHVALFIHVAKITFSFYESTLLEYLHSEHGSFNYLDVRLNFRRILLAGRLETLASIDNGHLRSGRLATVFSQSSLVETKAFYFKTLS